MNELLDDADRVNKSRPVLLTVLCILTWVGSAIQFGWGSWAIGDLLTSSYRNSRGDTALVVISLFALGSLLATLGSIRLFRLRKGLIIYLIGELIPPGILVTLCILSPPRGMFSELVYIVVGVALLISLLFIFLYVWVVLRNKSLFNGRKKEA